MSVERMSCCGELTSVYRDAGKRRHAPGCAGVYNRGRAWYSCVNNNDNAQEHQMFKVIATIQSGDNAPVDMPYLREGTAAQAIASVAALLADDIGDDDMPASIRTRLVSIRVDAV